MEAEPLVSRDEARAMLFAILDISVGVTRIKDLLEEALGGEEDSEDDA
jgi:hypothetical protein